MGNAAADGGYMEEHGAFGDGSASGQQQILLFQCWSPKVPWQGPCQISGVLLEKE